MIKSDVTYFLVKLRYSFKFVTHANIESGTNKQQAITTSAFGIGQTCVSMSGTNDIYQKQGS